MPKKAIKRNIKNKKETKRKLNTISTLAELCTLLNSKDNVYFKDQTDVFQLFEIKGKPNSKGFYTIKNSNYAIWFPHVSGKPKVWYNLLNCECNEILEKASVKYDDDNEKLKRIVFGKYRNGFKFLGVFMQFIDTNKKIIDRKKKRNNTFMKVSDSVMIYSKNI